MKSYTMCLLFLALVASTTGCRSLFPSESKTTRTPWQNFDEAQAAFDKITPHKTSIEELKSLGFDPSTTPNVKVLTYLDLIERFIPNQSITLADLQGCSSCVHGSSCSRCPGLAYLEGNMRGPSIQDCEKSYARTGVPSENLQRQKAQHNGRPVTWMVPG